jgi:hypothetical protein
MAVSIALVLRTLLCANRLQHRPRGRGRIHPCAQVSDILFHQSGLLRCMACGDLLEHGRALRRLA